MDDFETLLEHETSAFFGKYAIGLTTDELIAAGELVDRNPTEAQRAAGNYSKGHIKWNGLEIAIENPKGSVRRGVTKDGKPWETKLKDAYGYIKNTEGKDGDQADIFLCDENLDSEIVFVVNQIQPSTGRFDETKTVAGVVSEAQARQVYLRNYQDGWQGLDSIKPMTLPDFKDWLENGDHTKRAEEKKFTVAVDLDGTLAVHDGDFDANVIGAVIAKTRTWVKKFHEAGAQVLIWTTRGDKAKIRGWLKDNDVPFDAINKNPNQPAGTSQKIIADVYLDDRVVNVKDVDDEGPKILAKIKAQTTK